MACCQEVTLLDVINRFEEVGQNVLCFLRATETRELRFAHPDLTESLELGVILGKYAALHPCKVVAEGSKGSLFTELMGKPSADDVLNAAYDDARCCGGDLMKALAVQDECGRTPLYLAVKNSCRSALPVLLDLGAAIDFGSSTNGWSPLTLAAWKGSRWAITCLLDHGANPDHDGNSGGWTPLVAAASTGCAQACKELLDRGASLPLATNALTRGNVCCCRPDAALHLLRKTDLERRGLTEDLLSPQRGRCTWECDACTRFVVDF